MRKINLAKYDVEIGGEMKPYDVKASVISIMFSEHMKHTSQALMDYSDIKEKIKKAEDSVILEDAEFSKILNAVDTFQGFREIDLEFVKRIKNAETIDPNAK